MEITKIGETQILEIVNGNPEITKMIVETINHKKGKRPITNGSIKHTNTCITNETLIPWLLTIKN